MIAATEQRAVRHYVARRLVRQSLALQTANSAAR
jgi:hypothetical protein